MGTTHLDMYTWRAVSTLGALCPWRARPSHLVWSHRHPLASVVRLQMMRVPYHIAYLLDLYCLVYCSFAIRQVYLMNDCFT
jgi:hypothetical protein